MESIHTKIIIKGQGSRELVNEAKKEDLQFYNFFTMYESGSRVLNDFLKDFGLDRKVFCRRPWL